MKPVIIVHGGAWDWPNAHDESKRVGLAQAVRAGLELLKNGASALDAVTAAACVRNGLLVSHGVSK